MTPIPDLEADAIRWKLYLRDVAEQQLQAAVQQVRQRVGAPDNAVIELDQTGNMRFVEPKQEE